MYFQYCEFHHPLVEIMYVFFCIVMSEVDNIQILYV